MENATPLRAPQPDSERLTINLGYVDLGRIEMLVQEGFYANRSDRCFQTSANQSS